MMGRPKKVYGQRVDARKHEIEGGVGKNGIAEFGER